MCVVQVAWALIVVLDDAVLALEKCQSWCMCVWRECSAQWMLSKNSFSAWRVLSAVDV